jgi:hypothetical protein
MFALGLVACYLLLFSVTTCRQKCFPVELTDGNNVRDPALVKIDDNLDATLLSVVHAPAGRQARSQACTEMVQIKTGC